jgi:hypothetical protein
MKKIKIVHIHTDYKFIWPSLDSFKSNYFDNKIIILEGESHYICRFLPKPATHSCPNLPLIPGETCHPFLRKVYHFSGHFRNAENKV